MDDREKDADDPFRWGHCRSIVTAIARLTRIFEEIDIGADQDGIVAQLESTIDLLARVAERVRDRQDWPSTEDIPF